MKKWISGILAIVMIAALSVGAFAAPVNTGYSDVDPNASYAAAVKELTDKGIMDGVGGGKFDPSGTVTRAQAITVLGRMAGATQKETSDFSDIEAGSWYSGFVGWAVENGIVEGDGQGHFMPNQMVTSEHLNLMLSRYCKLMGIEIDLYDTGASTVPRVDLAQRLVSILNAGKTPEPSSPGTPSNPGIITPSNTKAIEAVFADTTSGGVMGYNENGINYFWGVPYAKAERFMPPAAYDSWSGYRVCWTIGESAPQNDSVSPFDFMPNSMQIVEDEANLFKLQIQSPDLTPAAPKPVVVWMHGGGYTTGASMEFDMYSGANLAEYGDVVFVGVNHRLNVLGFLDLSAYGSEYEYSGNVGILDLEFALQWIQDNIASFGGDPDNVTIIGQSGGGGKVTTLMSMPSAADLFHKAAALSGGSAQITRTTAQAQAQTAALCAALGITTDHADELKALSYEELYAAATAAGVNYGPVFDSDLIPTGTFVAESFDKPFMAGSVLGEFSTNIGGMATHNQASPAAFAENSLDLPTAQVLARLNTAYPGKDAQAILDAFRQAYPGHKDAGALYLNNRFNGFMVPSRMLQAMNDGGGTVYQYVQAYVYPMFGGVVPIHTASCIPFWFHNMEYIPAWIAGDEAAANRVADQMAGALASFAHTGNPSQNGLAWAPWTAENGAVMVFDTNSGVRYHHDDQLFDLIANANP